MTTEEMAKELFDYYAILMNAIAEQKAKVPELAQLEKEAEAVKKGIQDFAKETGEEFAMNGYTVSLSERDSWDTSGLPGFALAHPEINALKKRIVVATVKKAK